MNKPSNEQRKQRTIAAQRRRGETVYHTLSKSDSPTIRRVFGTLECSEYSNYVVEYSSNKMRVASNSKYKHRHLETQLETQAVVHMMRRAGFICYVYRRAGYRCRDLNGAGVEYKYDRVLLAEFMGEDRI